MRKNIYKLYVTASLALLCIGISTSAFAGLFPIEIDITQKTPLILAQIIALNQDALKV